jgi:hypothetical protein
LRVTLTPSTLRGSDLSGSPTSIDSPKIAEGLVHRPPSNLRVASGYPFESSPSVDLTAYRIPRLLRWSHDSPEEGLCPMEMVSFLEGLAHTDEPDCTCKVITAYVHRVNDMLGDDRQRLIPYLSRLVGTVSEEHQADRVEIVLRFTLSTLVPLAVDCKRYRRCAPALAAFNAARDLKTARRHLGTLSILIESNILDALMRALSNYFKARDRGAASCDAYWVGAVYHLSEALRQVIKQPKRFRLDNERIVQIALAGLDSLLSIGPSSGWSPGIVARLRQLEELAEVQARRTTQSSSAMTVPAVPIWKSAALRLRKLARNVCHAAAWSVRGLSRGPAHRAHCG